MTLQRSTKRRLVNAALSLPATLIWAPICAHYLFVFGFGAGMAVFLGSAPRTFSFVAVSVSLLCVGSLAGVTALWALILWKDELRKARKLPRVLLWSGLWMGFFAGLFGLGFACVTYWQSGLNVFVDLLFITVLGPIFVFLRELWRRRPLAANA